jgi:hypothetical protein
MLARVYDISGTEILTHVLISDTPQEVAASIPLALGWTHLKVSVLQTGPGEYELTGDELVTVTVTEIIAEG